jgi:hypothetical protein
MTQAAARLLVGGLLTLSVLAALPKTATAAGLGGVVMAAGGAVPTGAPLGSGAPRTCSPATLSVLLTYVEGGLSGRVSQLHALTGAVAGGTALSASDAATLSTDLANELSGITALEQKVPTDTTCADAIADAHAMVSDYRVYVVMTPQVHLTITADSETALGGRITGLEPQITAAIAAAGNAGKNVTAANRALAGLESQVGAAEHASSPIPSQVLGFTPASYPGCWPAFKADVGSLHTGRAALRRADSDLHVIVAFLH